MPSVSYLIIKRKFGVKYAASKKKNGHDPEKQNINFKFWRLLDCKKCYLGQSN